MEAADTKTDRCKKQKFMTMLAAGQLPDYLAKEWEKTVKMKVGRTDAQRTIINSCFNRGDMGKLILSLEKPLLQTMRNQWSERTASHTEKSLPKTLFMGQFEVRDPEGKVAYSWSASEHKTAKGDKSSFEMSATAQGSKGDAQKMNTLTGGWKMGLFSKQEQGAAAPGGKRTAAQLALEDRKQGLNDLQWQAAQEQLQPAIQAFQKIEKDGLKSLQIIGNDSKDDPLFVTLLLGWQLSMFLSHLCFVLVPCAGVFAACFLSIYVYKASINSGNQTR